VRHGCHGTHRYDVQVLATRVNMGASIFFTAAVIRAFRSARSRGNGGTYTVRKNQVNAEIFKFMYIYFSSFLELKCLIHRTVSYLFSTYLYLGLVWSRDKAVNLIWVAAQKR
jgi:hypothetical protein